MARTGIVYGALLNVQDVSRGAQCVDAPDPLSDKA
jgi:hypothetical protein